MHNHFAVQHRDGKEPYCSTCGLTEDYRMPKQRLSIEKITKNNTSDNISLYRYLSMPEFMVEAALVRTDNVDVLVRWCNGVRVEEIDALDPKHKYVGINVPGRDKTYRASEGYYISHNESLGFKVYDPITFSKYFELVEE